MTEVYFTFDTEDFTSSEAWDATVREANLLKKYGVKGNFNVVGFVAREWLRNKRYDVPEALKDHVISFHTLGHSYHPTICEITDLENYNDAKTRFFEQEAQGMGMVKAATGVSELIAACPPGNSFSYVAMYEYAEMGIPLYLGSVWRRDNGKAEYFCNALHTNYDYFLENLFVTGKNYDVKDYEVHSFLDQIASKKRVFIATHPSRAIHRRYWDSVNYKGGNLHPMYQWEPAPKYEDGVTERFFAQFEELLQALQSDDRFVICNTAQLAEKVRKADAARVVTKDQLPEIKRQLSETFQWVRLPSGTFSVADCFAAAAHFCVSDAPFRPGKVRGFLSDPLGVTAPVKLTAEEVRTLAKTYVPDAFLPTHYRIHGRSVGPADLLFAMLDVAMGADEATVTPRAQLPAWTGEFAWCVEGMPVEELCLKGTWQFPAEFEDKYLTHRLRLQNWTLRDEE